MKMENNLTKFTAYGKNVTETYTSKSLQKFYKG